MSTLPTGVNLPTITGESGTGDDLGNTVICEVCNQVLDEFQTPDGVDAWIHQSAWKVFDHVPRPKLVPITAAQATKCDFCGEPGNLVWQLIGARLNMGTPDGTRKFDSGWGVCGLCAPMLFEDRIDDLMDRVLSMGRLGPIHDDRTDTIMRQQLRKMWDAFLPTVRERVYLGGKRRPAALNPRLMPKLQQGLAKFWEHPQVQQIMGRPATYRAQSMTQSFPGVHCGDEDSFVRQFSLGEPATTNVILNHCRHLIAGIWTSELYWISDNFTKLATMAGQDFTTLSLHREKLPSPFGIMMFASPIGEIARPAGLADIRGVSWTLIPGGIWLNLYVQGEDADPEVDIEEMRREFGYLICTNAGSGIRFGDVTDLTNAPPEMNFIRTIFAAWFLLNQPGVAETTQAPVDKKYARSYLRAYGRRLPDVRLVDLRKQPRRHTASANHVGRPLTQRIFRKGHWKEQAYGPKRGMRKTIYVSDYIAGPDGAPLKQRPPTVRVLR